MDRAIGREASAMRVQMCLHCQLPICVEDKQARKLYQLAMTDCPIPRTNEGHIIELALERDNE